jgi:hypothetical protein
MKSLRHYLMESVKTYCYTIKIVGDCDKNFLQLFTHNLSKFDPVKIDEPKTTPIQKNPFGFPDNQNESVTIIKAEFKYPATEPMIQQCAQMIGCNINRVRATTTDFSDSINAESDSYANQPSPLLQHEQLEDNGKEASKDYANQYLDKVMPKIPSIEMHYDAPKTATAPNKSKEGINTSSPMSKIKLPARPSTGARK